MTLPFFPSLTDQEVEHVITAMVDLAAHDVHTGVCAS
jgi:hypothetical protein